MTLLNLRRKKDSTASGPQPSFRRLGPAPGIYWRGELPRVPLHKHLTRVTCGGRYRQVVLQPDLSVSAQATLDRLYEYVPPPYDGDCILPGRVGLKGISTLIEFLKHFDSETVQVELQTKVVDQELYGHLATSEVGPEARGTRYECPMVLPAWKTSTWIAPTAAELIRSRLRASDAVRWRLDRNVARRIRRAQEALGATEISLHPAGTSCEVVVGKGEGSDATIQFEFTAGSLRPCEIRFVALPLVTALKYEKSGTLVLNEPPYHSGVIGKDRLFGFPPKPADALQ